MIFIWRCPLTHTHVQFSFGHYLEENFALVTEGAMQQYCQTTYKLLETDLAILHRGGEHFTIKTRRNSINLEDRYDDKICRTRLPRGRTCQGMNYTAEYRRGRREGGRQRGKFEHLKQWNDAFITFFLSKASKRRSPTATGSLKYRENASLSTTWPRGPPAFPYNSLKRAAISPSCTEESWETVSV